MPQKIIVLGAGYAGIEAALTLQKKKKKRDDIKVTIIDKNSYHTLLTELHEVAGNRITEEGVQIPLHDIFRYTEVDIVKDEIELIDYENKTLKSKNNVYEYDYLVLATGSRPNFYGIPGMEEYAYTIWSFEDAVKIREHVRECFVLASQEKDAEKRKSLLTFIVGGGGFTGVEVVGELAIWFRDLCREYGILGKEVRLMLVEALPNILSILDAKNIQKAMKYLTKTLGVEVVTNCPITKLDKGVAELKTLGAVNTQTVIWTAGVQAHDIMNTGCSVESKSCRIIVDEFAETQYQNVYAVGDICAFKEGKSYLPAMVETALQTAKGAAKNILAQIRGNEKKTLHPKLHGVMVSIGAYYAVSQIMGRRLNWLLSVFMKYLVNVHYLFEIGGFEQVIKYLKHELVNKKQKKCIVARHYTTKSGTLFLVPLRIFFGYSWLVEGLNKVREGWLTNPVLAVPADAYTSASVTESGEKVFNIVSPHTPALYAWFAENFVVPNALFFQIMIVSSEVALGLAFITGTFTFLSGLAALGLTANFVLSTGIYPTTYWYIPAAIAMLGGAGRSFGVDHYLMPYLMRQWRYVVRNNKIKLFLFR